jgi:parallel beta-helix repeat protein
VITGLELTHIGEQGVYMYGCEAITFSGNTLHTIAHNGIKVDESTDIQISGNTISDIAKDDGEAGIQVSNCTAFELSGNTIEDAGDPGTMAWALGVYVNGECSDGAITGNQITDVAGPAIQIATVGSDIEVSGNTISIAASGVELGPSVNEDGDESMLTNVTVSDNVIWGVEQEAISAGAGSAVWEEPVTPLLGHVLITGNRLLGQDVGVGIVADWGARTLDDVEISNNLVADSLSVGIRIMAWSSEFDSWPTLTGFLVVNNTVVGSGDGPARVGFWGSGDPGDAEPEVTIRNNILTGGEDFSLTVEFPSVLVDYNLFTDFLGFPDETHGTNPVETADPAFADAGGGDYSLTAASPARNAGSATDAPAEDILGTARPQGAAVDIGAFEYVE